MVTTLVVDGWNDGDTLSDAALEGRDWVMRYSLQYFGPAERRPVSMPPDGDGFFFVDHGTALRPGRSSAAIFKDGEWLRLNKVPWKMKPTHWTKVEGLPGVPKL